MKIGIYFDNSNIQGVDLRNPEKGNPGVGGTPFCFVQLARYLHLYYSDIEILIFTHEKSLMPDGAEVVLVGNIYDAIVKSPSYNVDIFIFRPVYDEKIFSLIDEYKVKSITWGHNFYDNKLASLISRTIYIKRNVFVGRQQYDRYIDHPICDKSTFIFNSFNSDNKEFFRENDNKTVTYVGSLVQAKGFHILAKEWKNILKIVPDARLNVIGTGKVYSRNASLGEFNIADETYEKEFMRHLIDDDGNIHKSIEFLGILGQEKVNIFQKTSVGIVNPTARTETFGISGIEMQACGIPVVTRNKNGFPDTVLNGKTGILFKSEKQLAESVIKLLQNNNYNNNLGGNAKIFVKENFSPEKIIPQWEELFRDIMSNKTAKYIRPRGEWNNNFKWIRLMNRKIKKITRIKKIPALLDVEFKVKSLLSKKKPL